MTISKKENIFHKPELENLKAPGFRLLVLPDQQDDLIKKEFDGCEFDKETGNRVKVLESGLAIAEDSDKAWREKQTVLMQNSGVIISLGDACWKQYDDGQKWANQGDRVYFKRYCGDSIECTDGKIYKIILDTDVLLIERQEA